MRMAKIFILSMLLLSFSNIVTADKFYSGDGLFFGYEEKYDFHQKGAIGVTLKENTLEGFLKHLVGCSYTMIHVCAFSHEQDPEETLKDWMDTEFYGDVTILGIDETLVKRKYKATFLEYDVEGSIDEHDICLSWNEPGKTYLIVSAAKPGYLKKYDEASKLDMMKIANTIQYIAD